jgi:hypothetical protein
MTRFYPLFEELMQSQNNGFGYYLYCFVGLKCLVYPCAFLKGGKESEYFGKIHVPEQERSFRPGYNKWTCYLDLLVYKMFVAGLVVSK